MKEPHLQVTYLRGKAEIAYLYLPRHHGEKAHRSERVEPEMVLDFNQAGVLIGIELLDPERVSIEAINDVLKKHGLPPVSDDDLAPLRAAEQIWPETSLHGNQPCPLDWVDENHDWPACGEPDGAMRRPY